MDQQQRALTAQSLLTARLLADLPKLKGAVETRHAETVAPIAADYRRQVAADLLVISDDDRAAAGRGAAGAGGADGDGRAAALGGREVVEFRPDAGGVLQVATVPIAIGLESPDVLGAVSVGVRLDAQMAERFKRATRSEVAFTLDGAVRAATLPQSTWPALQPLLDASRRCRGSLIGDSEYVGRAQPLGDQRQRRGTPTGGRRRSRRALVLQSRTERLGFLRTVYAALALAAATAVLLAIGLSYAVARTITRPLGAITATMREVAATGRPDAKDPVARAVGLAGRGRAAAGDDLQHADRFGGALSARGRRRRSGCCRSGACRRSSRTRCATR